jgi:hypothetical protein
MTVADKTKPQRTRGPLYHRSLGTGHFALETHSEEVAAAMRSFLVGPSLGEGA